ncbi:hypothetical protein [Bacteroides acidifaciens]|uniref:hypothetical protein n=1 Tax=Bacteroides acidifaciens TaxID=85831 RepID=UPI0033901CAD
MRQAMYRLSGNFLPTDIIRPTPKGSIPTGYCYRNAMSRQHATTPTTDSGCRNYTVFWQIPMPATMPAWKNPNWSPLSTH